MRAAFVLAFFVASSTQAQQLVKATRTLSTTDGLTRSYDIYSSSAPLPGGRPVLLVFHGGASTKEQTPAITCPTGLETDPGCLNRLAALGPDGYLVVYPQGFMLSWNAGNCCGPAMSNHVDDVAFVAQLLDQIETDHDVDPGRIFATGFSNGAMLTHRLACDLADRIAAIAPISGGIGLTDAACHASRPVPVLEFHGTADANYPYDGGGDIPNTTLVGIPETIAGWVGRDGCSDSFSERRLDDAIPEDGTTVFEHAYGACDAEVVLELIQNGGHTWPNGSPGLTLAGFGTVSRDVDANEEMLSFFSRQTPATRSRPFASAPQDHRPRSLERPAD